MFFEENFDYVSWFVAKTTDFHIFATSANEVCSLSILGEDAC